MPHACSESSTRWGWTLPGGLPLGPWASGDGNRRKEHNCLPVPARTRALWEASCPNGQGQGLQAPPGLAPLQAISPPSNPSNSSVDHGCVLVKQTCYPAISPPPLDECWLSPSLNT